MSHFHLVDITNPPLGWSQREFIDAMHVLNKLNEYELQSIVEAINHEKLEKGVVLLPEESLNVIFSHFTPGAFSEAIYEKKSIFSRKKIFEKVTI
jgi:hypothetical protein